ncbi:MAG: NAD-dependent epimerase/dehydratase family protein [Deltaproteobacteria bacterium]|nr:NAD-dependent epimerase/dehydratase family protein [Deltaproteobacteria bacterium]
MAPQTTRGERRPPAARDRVVAITGAFGFIGTNLLKYLDADQNYSRIVAIDIKKPAAPMERMRFYKVDLTHPASDAELIRIFKEEKVDTVVHLAFLGNPQHNLQWAHELEVIGTLKALTACAYSGVGKFLMWSVTMVYGAHPSNPNFLTEAHPKRGAPGVSFVNDKLEAENEALTFAAKHPETIVTVLRTCTILGPTVNNVVTGALSRNPVPVLMGFDPLFQFVHEVDVVDAFKLALDHDFPGDFNIVGDGVMPLSTVLKLAGKVPLPLPYPVAKRIFSAVWSAQFTHVPPGFLDYFRYLWVADGGKARSRMKFTPKYSTKEALLNFVGTQRLRHVHLID